MDASYIKPFIDSTSAVFSTMLGTGVTFGKPSVVEASPQFDVSGIIGMSGDVIGSVVLSLPTTVAQALVRKFSGADPAVGSDDFSDAIGELVNMISGGAKAKFANKTVSISCPSVVVGKGHTVSRPSNTPCVSIPCRTEFGDFSIEIAIRPEIAAKAAA